QLVLIGRQACMGQHVGLELLLLREGAPCPQPAVEVLEHLRELRDDVSGVHGTELPDRRSRWKPGPGGARRGQRCAVRPGKAKCPEGVPKSGPLAVDRCYGCSRRAGGDAASGHPSQSDEPCADFSSPTSTTPSGSSTGCKPLRAASTWSSSRATPSTSPRTSP